MNDLSISSFVFLCFFFLSKFSILINMFKTRCVGRARASPAPRGKPRQSGDVILFGGPARHVLHTVAVIHPNTTPAPLLQLQVPTAHSQSPFFWFTMDRQVMMHFWCCISTMVGHRPKNHRTDLTALTV
jgi:hypothetical protein